MNQYEETEEPEPEFDDEEWLFEALHNGDEIEIVPRTNYYSVL